ncbi:MAG: WecB/TagA/CpsF family glycosyltransferase [Synergistes sp.]|nr:WecB/TagA/CpsF family glycosyltransferase [Synergistes sp.]
MVNASRWATFFIIVAAVLMCWAVQRVFKKYLDSDQYYYLKDIILVAAWALCGVWLPGGALRFTVAAGVASACIGFCQKVTQSKNIRFLYFAVALVFSVFGPRIAFIEYANGEYYYLSYFASVAISTIWVGIFPIFFQEIDEIPGLCGLLLTVSWCMVSAVILTSPRVGRDVSVVCVTGLVFLMVFATRHLYAYRRLTEPLTGLWGTLFGGITVLGVSKGITFYTLALLPLGFFALQITEIVLCVLCTVLHRKHTDNFMFYRHLIGKGYTHPSAICVVAGVCAVTGVLISSIQLGVRGFMCLSAVAVLLAVVILVIYKHKYVRTKMSGECRRPVLWGVTVDNISLNYAVSKVQHWLEHERSGHIIVTPDALAALRSRNDARYRAVVREAGLVLPDGVGLISALKLVGTPIQERIPGVEFTESLCKIAAALGRKVWLLGGEPGVARAASEKLKEKYKGLCIAGTRDGFFKKDEVQMVCEEIRSAGTDILLVGLGVPKQEYWLMDHIADTGAVVGIGIGGSMDVISGKLTRAPKVWQKMGIEWLYRLIQEPWRWRRMIKLPVFVWYVMLTYFHLDGYKDRDDRSVKTQ